MSIYCWFLPAAVFLPRTNAPRRIFSTTNQRPSPSICFFFSLNFLPCNFCQGVFTVPCSFFSFVLSLKDRVILSQGSCQIVKLLQLRGAELSGILKEDWGLGLFFGVVWEVLDRLQMAQKVWLECVMPISYEIRTISFVWSFQIRFFKFHFLPIFSLPFFLLGRVLFAEFQLYLFRITRADWSQGRRCQALGSWGSEKPGRAGQWVKGGANRVSL